REELQLWVANRFYYQINIPVKDALILANCPEREVRQQWIQRIIDHDGRPGEEGGIEAWLRLGEAMGVARSELLEQRRLLPGPRSSSSATYSGVSWMPWSGVHCRERPGDTAPARQGAPPARRGPGARGTALSGGTGRAESDGGRDPRVVRRGALARRHRHHAGAALRRDGAGARHRRVP